MLFDWCFVVIIGCASVAFVICNDGALFDIDCIICAQGLFFCCMASFSIVAFIGVFPLPFTITFSEESRHSDDLGAVIGKYLGRTFWLNKYLQEGFAIVFIVMHMMNGESNLVFRFFGRATIVSFTLQYFLLYFVLKWASAVNPGCPTPSNALIFPFCCNLKQDKLYSDSIKRDKTFSFDDFVRLCKSYVKKGEIPTGGIVYRSDWDEGIRSYQKEKTTVAPTKVAPA